MPLSEQEEFELLSLERARAVNGNKSGDPRLTGIPNDFAAPPAEKPKKGFLSSALDSIISSFEVPATLATGAVGTMGGAMAALPKLMTQGQPAANESFTNVQNALTYRPRSDTAQATLESLGGALEFMKVPPMPINMGSMAGMQSARALRNESGASVPLRDVASGAIQNVSPRAAAILETPKAAPIVEGAANTLTQSQAEALKTLRSFAKDPDAIGRTPNNQIIKGSQPTLAELTQDPGLAQLQRTQQSKSTALASDLAENKAAKGTARKSLMEEYAGSEGELQYYKDARKAIAEPLYKKALDSPIDPKRVTPELQNQMTDLMQRPSIKEAQQQAIKLARDEGVNLAEQDMGSMRGLHYMKMAIDEKISAAKTAQNNNQVRILTGLQDNLVGVMQKLSPDYAKATAEFAEASKPINRMEVGQYLKEKLFPATNNHGADITTVNQFAKALAHPDQTARLATKFPGAKLENIFTKEEITQLKNLADDVVRQANVESAARITGSQTAQLMAAQGKLANAIDKMKYAPSGKIRLVGKAAEWAKDKMMESSQAAHDAELNKMLMNPEYARFIDAASRVKDTKQIPQKRNSVSLKDLADMSRQEARP